MTKIMTALQFVDKAKAIANMNTVYQLGTFGNRIVDGKIQWDCSGLIKGILWGYPENGKYGSQGVLDQNADTIIQNCLNVSTDFSCIESGEVVWMKGHIGIYIGNGEVIEATPRWSNGVQITSCINVKNSTLKARRWIKHGQLPYLTYENDYQTDMFTNWVKRLQTECNKQGFSKQKVDGIPGKITLEGCPTLSKTSKGEITKLMQERLVMLTYNVGQIDGINGLKTQNAIKAFQSDYGLNVDGIVGKNTWQKLLKL